MFYVEFFNAMRGVYDHPAFVAYGSWFDDEPLNIWYVPGTIDPDLD